MEPINSPRLSHLAKSALLPYILSMLAKLTSKNQLTLPKRMVDAVGHPTYFEIAVDDGRLVLTPARIGQADAVRQKLVELGITENDVEDAIIWARRQR